VVTIPLSSSSDQYIIENKEVFKKAGSTAVVAIVNRRPDNTRWLYVANVGDARAVLWYVA
jgi:serine/threonine protein phosphatase PrpC